MQLRRARRVLAGASTAALLSLAALPATASASQYHRPDRITEAEDDTDASGESLHPSGQDRDDHQDLPQGNAQSEPDADGHGPDRNDHDTDKPGETGGLYPGDQDGNNGCGNDQDFEDDNEGWCGKPDDTEEESDDDTEEEPGEETEEESDEDESEEETEEESDEETEEEPEEETVEDADVESEGDVEVRGEQLEGDDDTDTDETDADDAETESQSDVEVATTQDDVEVLGVILERPNPNQPTPVELQPSPPAPSTTTDAAITPEVAGTSLEAAGAPSLPRTGSPVFPGLLTGLASISTGVVALRRSRR